jgi:hypothetical protein
MRKGLFIWGLGVCFAFTLTVSAEESNEDDSLRLIDRLKDKMYFGGSVKFETAVETTTGDGQKAELQIQPEIEFSLNDDTNLVIIPRLRFDALDELEPGRPDQDEIWGPSRRWLLGDPLELELRELFVETVVGDTYLTVGKQQVVWGESDGLKVLDVVNPSDLREFGLAEFEDSRIPLWTVNAEIPIKDATLQLLWIPDTTKHNIPEFGSTYDLFNVPIPPGVTVDVENYDRPNNPISDSDYGARLSGFWKGWNLSLNYFYHYDDVPVVFTSIGVGPGGAVITASPTYKRTHLIGGTFSKAFGDLTLRGELGYSTNKYYSVDILSDPDSVHESGEFGYVIGLDWFGFSDMMLSFQFFQSIIDDDVSGLGRDKVDNTISLLVRRSLKNESLSIYNILVHNLNSGDGYVRPKLSYQVSDTTSIWGGFDIFYGSDSGLFGQFDHRDRVVVGMEWAF